MSEKVVKKEGPVIGFELPLVAKNHAKKVKEMLEANPDIDGRVAMGVLSKLGEADAAAFGEMVELDVSKAADYVREKVIRELVSQRVREVVRKKPGGGGFVLYSPNKGKKKNPKPAGTFPTKLGAKRAELARFPPKDPGKLARLRKEVDRLVKKPNKDAKKEDIVRHLVRALIAENLFREERSGSEWDEHLSKLSKQAVASDKKFQAYQRAIEKKTESVLQDAFASIAKATKKDVDLKNLGIKHSPEKGKTYLAFMADIDEAETGPYFIYADNGIPKIEVSDQAKASMTKADPAIVKKFRAELITVQERVLDRVEELVKAVSARDKYLTKLEDEVDGFVAELTPLQVSILKNLLVSKYRKLA